jgi:CspA family cold shock protein
MPDGTVKWYDCKKGFGFILDSAGEDVFVHFSVIEGDGFRRLFDGEIVEYEAIRSPKGLQATCVRHTSTDPQRPGKGKPSALSSKPPPPARKADAAPQTRPNASPFTGDSPALE